MKSWKWSTVLTKIKNSTQGILEEVYRISRPKNASLERAHGLPKTQKDFIHLFKFRPIIDGTSSTHYPAG